MKAEKGREEDKEGVSGGIRELHADKTFFRLVCRRQFVPNEINGSLGWLKKNLDEEFGMQKGGVGGMDRGKKKERRQDGEKMK